VRDLAGAIMQFEPVCAALCAQRPDRMMAVVPRLREIHERQQAAADDPLAFATIAREFHEGIVELAGNETIKLIMGALEEFWSAGGRVWAQRATSTNTMPDERTRHGGLRAHERMIELIVKGDASKVEAAARRHLESAQLYAVADAAEPVKAASVRSGRSRPSGQRSGA